MSGWYALRDVSDSLAIARWYGDVDILGDVVQAAAPSIDPIDTKSSSCLSYRYPVGCYS